MKKEEMMFTIYNQLGTHMWKSKQPLNHNGRYVSDKVLDREPAWRKRMEYARAAGANTVVVEIAEMLKYPSHPEIWIDGAWDAEKMNGWVKWLKSIGFREVFPSLNFSTSHDLWLGEYSRMISTPAYYKVCRDLIKDTYEVFEKPRIFHFGMDEEEPTLSFLPTLKANEMIVCRQGDLYWNDNLFFIREIEKLGAQALMAADKIWFGIDAYVKHIPKSVLQTNWYYGTTFDKTKLPKWMAREIDAYLELEKHGYEQLPGCSNWLHDHDRKTGMTEADSPNIEATFKFCKENVAPERLKGFLVMPWSGVDQGGDKVFYNACDKMKAAIAAY